MKISVIVPVYNVEQYLEECLDSVLLQTYRDFEIIIVNDGSTDKSAQICTRYAQKYYQYISVICQENQGVFVARLEGIRKACGDIIVFLDSDDTFRKDALEVIFQSFCRYDCDILLYDAGVCGNYSSVSVYNNIADNKVYDQLLVNDLYRELISCNIPNNICLKAVRRKCINLPERFKDIHQVRYGEDLIMSACFISSCKRVTYIKQGLYYYRNRPGSAVNSFNIHRSESIKIVHTEIEKQIEELGLLNLKPLHNSRKVKGWIDCVILLLKNLKVVGKQEFFRQIKSMAEDEYFIKAYQEMDCNSLSIKRRIIAFCLYKKQYFLLYSMSKIFQYKNLM